MGRYTDSEIHNQHIGMLRRQGHMILSGQPGQNIRMARRLESLGHVQIRVVEGQHIVTPTATGRAYIAQAVRSPTRPQGVGRQGQISGQPAIAESAIPRYTPAMYATSVMAREARAHAAARPGVMAAQQAASRMPAVTPAPTRASYESTRAHGTSGHANRVTTDAFHAAPGREAARVHATAASAHAAAAATHQRAAARSAPGSESRQEAQRLHAFHSAQARVHVAEATRQTAAATPAPRSARGVGTHDAAADSRARPGTVAHAQATSHAASVAGTPAAHRAAQAAQRGVATQQAYRGQTAGELHARSLASQHGRAAAVPAREAMAADARAHMAARAPRAVVPDRHTILLTDEGIAAHGAQQRAATLARRATFAAEGAARAQKGAMHGTVQPAGRLMGLPPPVPGGVRSSAADRIAGSEAGFGVPLSKTGRRVGGSHAEVGPDKRIQTGYAGRTRPQGYAQGTRTTQRKVLAGLDTQRAGGVALQPEAMRSVGQVLGAEAQRRETGKIGKAGAGGTRLAAHGEGLARVSKSPGTHAGVGGRTVGPRPGIATIGGSKGYGKTGRTLEARAKGRILGGPSQGQAVRAGISKVAAPAAARTHGSHKGVQQPIHKGKRGGSYILGPGGHKIYVKR